MAKKAKKRAPRDKFMEQPPLRAQRASLIKQAQAAEPIEPPTFQRILPEDGDPEALRKVLSEIALGNGLWAGAGGGRRLSREDINVLARECRDEIDALENKIKQMEARSREPRAAFQVMTDGQLANLVRSLGAASTMAEKIQRGATGDAAALSIGVQAQIGIALKALVRLNGPRGA